MKHTEDKPQATVLEVEMERLLVPGRSHLIVAPAGQGKTMVALILAKEVIDRGGRVVFMSPPGHNATSDLRQRLRAVGIAPPISPEDCDPQFRLVSDLTVISHTSPVGDWVSKGDAPGLVIVDAVDRMPGAWDADEYQRWWREVAMLTLDAMEEHGAMLLLDYVLDYERFNLRASSMRASYRLEWDDGQPVAPHLECNGRLSVEIYRGLALVPYDEIYIQTWPDPSGGLGWRLSTTTEEL